MAEKEITPNHRRWRYIVGKARREKNRKKRSGKTQEPRRWKR
jgi:hypothetical protein